MSQFENYTDVSSHYDLTRQPGGLEIILGALASGTRPLADQKVLDAGCGTGNYVECLADSIGRMEGIELNPGMLSVAQSKVSLRADVELRQGSILDLPYEPEAFDGVLVNYVLHHLEEGADPGFAATRSAIEECYRVLAPGGTLVIQTASAAQYHDAFWYSALIPDAVDRVLRRFLAPTKMAEVMQELGLESSDRFVPLDQILQGDGYLDPTGPARQEWRDGDSVWALVKEDELDAAIGEVERMRAAGELDAFFEDREAKRRRLGQATFVVGRKPLAEEV